MYSHTIKGLVKSTALRNQPRVKIVMTRNQQTTLIPPKTPFLKLGLYQIPEVSQR